MRTIAKDIVFKRITKAIVDVLLVIGLLLSMKSAHVSEPAWWSFHCIVSMLWYVLMLLHIGQHWQMTKALLTVKWKAIKRNKTTLLTIIVFILITFSLIFFIVGISDRLVRIHHTIADIFKVVVIIHAIVKVKQFLACFR